MSEHNSIPSAEEEVRPVKRRKHITDAQRQTLRRYAAEYEARHGKKAPHAVLRDWWLATYGWTLAFSMITFMLSEKFSYLDGEGVLIRPDAKRSVAPAWPDLEAALWDWQQYYEELHNVKASGDLLKEQAAALWTTMGMYQDKDLPNFSSGWLQGYKERHGMLSRQKDNHTMDQSTGLRKGMALTEWLSSKDPVASRRACQESAFLEAAATGQLSSQTAVEFLAQQRLIAIEETKFLGSTLAKIPMCSTSQHHLRILSALSHEISKLDSRIAFLDQMIAAYAPSTGTTQSTSPSTQTLSHVNLLSSAAAPSTPLLPSLSLWWTLLKLRQTAYTTTHLSSISSLSTAARHRMQIDREFFPYAADADGGIFRHTILPALGNDSANTTLHTFASMLNRFAESSAGDSSSADERRHCEIFWRQAVACVEASWPSMQGASDAAGEQTVENLPSAVPQWQLDPAIQNQNALGETRSAKRTRGAKARGSPVRRLDADGDAFETQLRNALA